MGVTSPAITHEDNLPVVLSSTNPGSNLQHKVMPLSYHYCREYVTGRVAEVRHAKSKLNIIDALTKGLDTTNFHNCFMPFMTN